MPWLFVMHYEMYTASCKYFCIYPISYYVMYFMYYRHMLCFGIKINGGHYNVCIIRVSISILRTYTLCMHTTHILHFIYLLSLYNECNRVRDPSQLILTHIFTDMYNYINRSLAYSLSCFIILTLSVTLAAAIRIKLIQ